MARRVGMYFAWDRLAETDRPLGDLNNRFPALHELRRQFWPRFESFADAPGGQDIDGYLQAVFFHNYARFEEQVAALTGIPLLRAERRSAAGETLLTDQFLENLDTLIIISFDSKRTAQTVTGVEVESVRAFLARSDTALFVCPHHDIGDSGHLPDDAALDRLTAEYLHHGDAVLPGQQRTGGFALSLMAELGAPIRNRFGLRPAVDDRGEPAALQVTAQDWQHLLHDVPNLNLHPHLPQFERLGPGEEALEVLVRQVVSKDAPRHPDVQPGDVFDSVLQARQEVGFGRLTICDATLWTSNNGGVEGLEAFWGNVLRGDDTR